tara:strand:- start:6424 stop:6825 length:402 start_codon:yes stop_codon:yes gene_type:complete
VNSSAFKQQSRTKSSFDWVGISLSGLCLVHCLFLPVVLAVLPLLALAPLPEWLHDTEWLHAFLLVPVVLVSGPALLAGARKDRRIAVFAALAFTALFTALLMESEWGERGLTVTGALFLVRAHWLNLKSRHTH